MGGGLLQLAAYGSQNDFINGNPQMTFFKIVYRRYTNFSMEFIPQVLKGPNRLDINNDIKLNCKIGRNGDLLKDDVDEDKWAEKYAEQMTICEPLFMDEAAFGMMMGCENFPKLGELMMKLMETE